MSPSHLLTNSSDSSLLTSTIHKSDSFLPLLMDPYQILINAYSTQVSDSSPYPCWWIFTDPLTDPLSDDSLMTHSWLIPLLYIPLTLSCRHTSSLYISQPSGYLVAPVLTWSLSHYCLVTIPVGYSLFIPMCDLPLSCPFCPFLKSSLGPSSLSTPSMTWSFQKVPLSAALPSHLYPRYSVLKDRHLSSS